MVTGTGTIGTSMREARGQEQRAKHDRTGPEGERSLVELQRTGAADQPCGLRCGETLRHGAPFGL